MNTIEDAKQQLEGITTALINRVMAKLDGTEEAEEIFVEWYEALIAGKDDATESAWRRLRPHIKFPI